MVRGLSKKIGGTYIIGVGGWTLLNIQLHIQYIYIYTLTYMHTCMHIYRQLHTYIMHIMYKINTYTTHADINI